MPLTSTQPNTCSTNAHHTKACSSPLGIISTSREHAAKHMQHECTSHKGMQQSPGNFICASHEHAAKHMRHRCAPHKGVHMDILNCTSGAKHCIPIGMARSMYIQCTYGIFCREITKDTVIYGVYIRFWPTLHIKNGAGLTLAAHSTTSWKLRACLPSHGSHLTNPAHPDKNCRVRRKKKHGFKVVSRTAGLITC